MTRTQRSLLITVTVIGGSLLAAGFVWAFLTGNGTGSATATIGVLNPATNVTVPSTSGSPVHVTWTATSAPVGGNVTGYYVERYSGATGYAACGTSPSSLLAGSATSCDDSATSGTYTYKVIAVWHSWTSTSAASGSVVVTAGTATIGAPSPTSGTVGSSVTITGTGFAPSTALTVTLGGTSATITSGATSAANGSVNVTFTVPATTAGSKSVVVSDGTSSPSSSTLYIVGPSISLTPTSGVAGSTVSASGAGFAASQALSATFNGSAITLYGTTSTGANGSFSGATFTVPNLAAASYTVTFLDASVNNAGTSFTIPAPSISLSPTSGAAGTSVTITGSNFPASSSVGATWDGGALAISPATSTNTSGAFSGVTFTAPGSTSGSHTVQVAVNGRSASATFSVSLPSCSVNNSFISVATGNWNATGTWLLCNGTSWGAAGHTPTSTDAGITVQAGNTVTVTADVTADQLVVNSGGNLTVNGSVTLTLANGTGSDLTTNGTTTINGTLSVGASADVAVTAGTTDVFGTFTLGSATALDVAGGATMTIKSGGLLQGGGGNGSTAPPVTIEGTYTISSGGTSTGTSTAGLSYTVNSGGVLNVDGSVGGSTSNMTINSGGQGNVTGTITLSSVSNLTVNSGGNLAMSGSSTVSGTRGNGGNVIVVNGTATLSGTATISALGSGTMTVSSGGTLELGPTTKVAGNIFTLASGGNLKVGSTVGITSSGATGNVQSTTRNYNTGANYTYNGTAAQVTGNGFPATVNTLTVDNASGVSLTAAVAMTNGGTVTTGALGLGAFNATASGSTTLTVATNGTITRSTGFVIGNLQKAIATGSNVTQTYEVGTAGGYTPVTVVFGSVSTGGNLTVKANANDSPNIATSTLVATKSLNRYWTLTNAATVFTSYSATFGFPGTFGSTDAQLDTGTNTANLRVGNYTGGAWSYPTLGTRTGTSTQATGITTVGDFQLAE